MVAPFQPVVWWNWRQCHLVPSTVLPSRLPFRRSNDFLWRISAITIKITLVTEFLSMLSWLASQHVDARREIAFNLKLVRWPIGVLRLSSLISLILYIVARMILLILAFSTLSYLPVEVYRTVSWTIHIPHII